MVLDAGVPTHLASIWAAISEELGDETALVHGERRVSWRDFDARDAARFTSALAAEGLTPGSVVAIDLYNCPESFEVFYAAIKAGFVPTMVNYRYREGELEHLLDDAEAEVVVAHPELCEPVRAAAGRLPGLRRIVVVGEDYEELIESNPPWERPVDPEGGSMLSYTGGTTGLPKGVVYPMPRLARQALRTRAW